MTSKVFWQRAFCEKKPHQKGGRGKGISPPGFENVGIPFKDLPFSFYLPIRIFLILFRGCFLLFSSSSLKVCYSTQPTKRKREFSRYPQRCLFSSSSALLELVAATVAEAEHCAKRGGFLLHPGWYLCNSTMNQKYPPAADKAIKRDKEAIFWCFRNRSRVWGGIIGTHVASKNYRGFWKKLLAYKFPS